VTLHRYIAISHTQ